MERRVKLEDQVFGQLTVVAFAGADAASNARWSCQCSCGVRCVVLGNDLRRGHTTSCGCYRKQNNKLIASTHGQRRTSTYNIWAQMKQRCQNPKAKSYVHYGARGVQVCPRWQSFENFFADMGRRPSRKHTLDRKDTNGNYEKSNCRWSIMREQNRNKRNTNRIDGKTQAEWAEELGVSQSAVSRRYKRHGTVTLPELKCKAL